MIEGGFVHPGDRNLVIKYKFDGIMHEFFGSLNADGTILEVDTGTTYPRPSSWSIVAKRRFNQEKLADDGE